MDIVVIVGHSGLIVKAEGKAIDHTTPPTSTKTIAGESAKGEAYQEPM